MQQWVAAIVFYSMQQWVAAFYQNASNKRSRNDHMWRKL
jgi:hypothetical protein